MNAISHDLTTNLFGNPHSGASASQLSSRRIEDTRVQVLNYLNADPEIFDAIFVANATAGIKLVTEAFRDNDGGFFYGYHVDSHTSLVGVRELADLGSKCFSENEVDKWLTGLWQQPEAQASCSLFGYPGQSNLSGYRPPLSWCSRIYELRHRRGQRMYSLYDAAARLSTAPMDFRNDRDMPDFTVLSFYKIFGLPDLGALIIRKECAEVFSKRKFFGGGTVDMVISLGDQWHASRQSSLHSRLEDGTVPFHSIIALQSALSTHIRLFGSMYNISRHTAFLAKCLHKKLSSLTHSSGVRVCQIYGPAVPDYQNSHGPTIAFNLQDAEGGWIGRTEVEKLASVRSIQLRTGGLCNPGGIATHLELSASELRRNFASGQKCGDDNDVLNGKPTGVIRVSFGAMSNITDAHDLVDFIEDFFVGRVNAPTSPPLTPTDTPSLSSFHIQSLSIFPIKSCAAFKIPLDTPWEIRTEGLAWDREWCLVHQGTGTALDQKKYPKMALLRPTIDLEQRLLTVHHYIGDGDYKTLKISLDAEAGTASQLKTCNAFSNRSARICGQSEQVQIYISPHISDFFTSALDVPCTLARHQKALITTKSLIPSSPPEPDAPTQSMPGHFPSTSPTSANRNPSQQKKEKTSSLANESPILLISQSSLDALNSTILQSNNFTNPSSSSSSSSTIPVPADAFRANIVIAQSPHEEQTPYAEDRWKAIQIGDDGARVVGVEVLGPCQRCHMVCVDQSSGVRGKEPFSSLARTRRRAGKVWFGIHLCLTGGMGPGSGIGKGEEDRRRGGEGVGEGEKENLKKWFVKAGDVVRPI